MHGEGDAEGLEVQAVDVLGRPIGAVQRADLRDCRAVDAREHDLVATRGADVRVVRFGAEDRDDEDRRVGRARRDLGDDFQHFGIGFVEVVEHEQDRRVGRPCGQATPDARAQRLAGERAGLRPHQGAADRPQRLVEQRPRRAMRGVAAGVADDRAAGVGFARELGDEPGLADALGPDH